MSVYAENSHLMNQNDDLRLQVAHMRQALAYIVSALDAHRIRTGQSVPEIGVAQAYARDALAKAEATS